MGYTTYFTGQIDVTPSLNDQEREFLQKFSGTRRMKRTNGPYFVEGTGFMGQGGDPDIQDYNTPPDGQPGLWCHWVPNEKGTAIEWDEGKKFYDGEEWMKYLIDHFIGPNPIAKRGDPDAFAFLQGHDCQGVIDAEGEDSGDIWKIIVENNEVYIQEARIVFDEGRKVV